MTHLPICLYVHVYFFWGVHHYEYYYFLLPLLIFLLLLHPFTIQVESSAASCGLLKGDKVVSIQSTPIHTKHEALSLLTPLKPGSSVILTIQRKGVTRSMEIVFVVGAVGYTNEQVALLQRVANYNQKDFDDIEGLLLFFLSLMINKTN